MAKPTILEEAAQLLRATGAVKVIPKKKKKTYFISEALLKEFDLVSGERGLKPTDAISEAIAAWLVLKRQTNHGHK